MKPWRGVALALGSLAVAAIVVPRYFWFRRRSLPDVARSAGLSGGSYGRLAIAHLAEGHTRLVILAHGFMKSMNDHQLVAMAGALREHFDVLTFDLPGHGQSEGESDITYVSAAQVLHRLIDHARTLGYARLGVVGYSLGAAAGIIAVAQGAPVDALVSVSCPGAPVAERLGGAGKVPWPWRWWMRLMGTRVAPRLQRERWPVEFVDRVSPVPLLVVHDALDVLVRREESETLFAVARPPKDWLLVEGAVHAWPMASAPQVIQWLERNMPLDERGRP